MTDDPADFVAMTLAACPSDPKDASLDDLRTLMAAAEGLTRHALALRAAMAELARCAPEGADQVLAAAAERAELQRLHERSLLADERLNAYTTRALKARGINP